MQLSPKQKEFWNAPFHRWNIKYGATRSGKTYLDYFMIPRRIRERRGKDGLIVLMGNTKGTLQRNIIEPMQKIYGEYLVSSIRADNTAHLFGERVHCLGADSKKHVDRLRGSSIAYCYGDETVTWAEVVFEMLKSRLDKPYSCFDGTCNPKDPDHWFKKFIDSDADIFAQHYALSDNPFLDATVRAEMEREHSGVFYERYILGNWTVAEGLIYGQFARDPAHYTVPRDRLREYLKDAMFASIGIDFGGNRSLTTFVATAIHTGFRKVTTFADYHIEGKKGEIDADRLCREFIGFVQRLRLEFPWLHIKYCWADSEAQYLINSLRNAARRKGLGFDISDCKKRAILDRIIVANTLLNTGRMSVAEGCTLVQGGLKSAVWDAKKPDTRLDNFSTDIDILDAFEYSWEPFIMRLCPDLKGG